MTATTVSARVRSLRSLPTRRPSDRVPPAPSDRRDVSLDLLRGLAMVILVVNHVHLETPLEHATRAFLSAAEVLVLVSGVVVGMVFGRRWIVRGARATTVALLRRARTLYVASVVVVGLVGLLTLVPGAATDVLAFSPRAPDRDLYGFDGPVRMLFAILTLEAGPWQFNILGFFIASLVAAPAVLHALERGWWPAVVLGSLALYLLGRSWTVDVLPAQSERPFPFLVWQLLFVQGMVLGWYRDHLTRFARRHRTPIVGTVVALALAAVAYRLQALGAGPATREDWAAFQLDHYRKTSLDPLRILAIGAMTAAVYIGFRRFERPIARTAGRVLLPLGRNSFYVFIVHVFLCLAVASVPPLAGENAGDATAIAVQVACVAALWLMVRHRILFRWIPR
ncbi:MAG: hypothetical protein AVDCRST_MAG30-3568 [uncultured Solirubrobacteraceae bacterium]|uniref:OpgC protein n=1 Tax=uncultured Solirubrobacteraceae bacterium TaxID=1162706 RepID=A0A6J4TNS6_9ACTN|nr:MAG: hypothetical protein AVDCRST_MAG30-3568 [uncultured Solirubrobacteraceae bacterium]